MFYMSELRFSDRVNTADGVGKVLVVLSTHVALVRFSAKYLASPGSMSCAVAHEFRANPMKRVEVFGLKVTWVFQKLRFWRAGAAKSWSRHQSPRRNDHQ